MSVWPRSGRWPPRPGPGLAGKPGCNAQNRERRLPHAHYAPDEPPQGKLTRVRAKSPSSMVSRACTPPAISASPTWQSVLAFHAHSAVSSRLKAQQAGVLSAARRSPWAGFIQLQIQAGPYSRTQIPRLHCGGGSFPCRVISILRCSSSGRAPPRR